jgi:hypothetical protein
MAKERLELTGQKFGRLTAIRIAEKRKHKKYYWECKCECGNICVVMGTKLKNGYTKSCGCLLPDLIRETKTTHGLTHSKTYKIWASMKKRCDNPADNGYHKYGARGIKYCEKWGLFENFFSDMGLCPSGYSIERINNNGDYEPDNCKWIPLKDQARNRRSNRYITYNGITKTIIQWSEHYNIEYRKLYVRLVTLNWTPELAFNTPLIKGKR